MRVIAAAEVSAALDVESLIERLRQAFRRSSHAPVCQRYALTGLEEPEATLAVMPAWQGSRYIGLRFETLFPSNPERGLPAAMGAYLLLDGHSGAPLALIDGPQLVAKRTAAASALASGYLSRPDCHRLLMVGSGALAAHLVLAHAAVRPIKQVRLWNRTPEKAQRLAKRLTRRALNVEPTTDLKGAVEGADLICCATDSPVPLLAGDWLRPGQHIDLVGGHSPRLREADDEAVRRARVFVDSRNEACRDAGDIAIPLETGVLNPSDIAADLFELTRGERAGRRFYDQITLFKSVGCALEDLAAAQLVVERV